MKFLKVFSLIVLAVFVFSCEKDEVKSQIEESSSESSDVIKMVQDEGDDDVKNAWEDNGKDPGGVDGVDFGCIAKGTNCSTPGPIYSGSISANSVQKLFELVEETSGEETSDYILNNFDVLSEVLPAEMLDLVIHEGFTLSSRGAYLSETKYLIFRDQEKEVFHVCPLKIVEK